MKTFTRSLFTSLVLVILCGLIYPLTVTGISQLLFPKQANGSLVMEHGKPVGSELLGQSFTDPRFFHGRVSAVNYNTYDSQAVMDGKTVYAGVSSGSTNLAPSNPALVERVNQDLAAFLKANPDVRQEDIPTDLLTASGSGLDPDISPQAAAVQIPAIAKATGLSPDMLEKLVSANTTGRTLGIFGEPRVNVLQLNLGIEELRLSLPSVRN